MVLPRVPSDEHGNTLILSITLSAVAIALVLTFAAITQIHIERKRLLSLTDTAVLHAAGVFDEGHYYAGNTSEVPLTDSSVKAGVEEYLSLVPHQHYAKFHELTITDPTGVTPEGSAQVTLRAFIRPGYIPWGVIGLEGFRIETTAQAVNL